MIKFFFLNDETQFEFKEKNVLLQSNKKTMKKYIAELIGTMVLVLMGCGSAVIAGMGIGLVGISFSFGLSLLIMVYAIGPISGCHVNPAITFAMWVSKKISGKDALFYVVAQVVGAFIGIGILAFMVGHKEGLAVNSVDPYGFGYTIPQAVVCETIMTFLLTFVVFATTEKKSSKGFAGIAIGLTLALIHLVTIPITNTSVNPARALAPAVLDGGAGMTNLWIFILAPLVGAGLAALCWMLLNAKEKVPFDDDKTSEKINQ